MSLQFTATEVSVVDITGQTNFFETFAAAPVDRVIHADVNLNGLFKYSMLPFNVEDENDSTNEQVNILAPDSYKQTVYNMFEHYKFQRSSGIGWSDLIGENNKSLALQVKEGLEDLFETGDMHDLGFQQNEITYISLYKVKQWCNGQALVPGTSFGHNVFTKDQIWELMDASADAGLFKLESDLARADPLNSGQSYSNSFFNLSLTEGTVWSVRIQVKHLENNISHWLLKLRHNPNIETFPTYNTANVDFLTSSGVVTDPYNPPSGTWSTVAVEEGNDNFILGPSENSSEVTLEINF